MDSLPVEGCDRRLSATRRSDGKAGKSGPLVAPLPSRIASHSSSLAVPLRIGAQAVVFRLAVLWVGMTHRCPMADDGTHGRKIIAQGCCAGCRPKAHARYASGRQSGRAWRPTDGIVTVGDVVATAGR